MTSWQRRARLGVAVLGLAVAATVYFGLRDREPRAPAGRVERTDPRAVLETTAGQLQQVRGEQLDFEIWAARTLGYEDGSTRQFDVRITVHREDERTYVITADQAEARQDRTELHLSGAVTLRAEDGFELRTGQASFNQNDGLVSAPGEVAFERGSLRGSGVGMSYDVQQDLLQMADRAEVRLAEGETPTAFTSDTAALDRVRHQLRLAGDVRTRRGGQTIESGRLDAQLSPTLETITFIELRGGARVSGGAGSPGTMAARDIDLAYDDTGDVLERVALVGGALVTIEGDGTAEPRRLAGDRLDLQLARDGSLVGAQGAGRVRLDVPAGEATQPGAIHADRLRASGVEGTGLTEAHFSGGVEYVEPDADGGARTVRARQLQTMLTGDTIGDAVFTTDVRVEADGYEASAGEARYHPSDGALQLRGGESREQPRVLDGTMTVSASSIDLALEGRHLTARGGVQTVMAPGGDGGGARLPGLLETDTPAQVTADALVYDGAAEAASYTGNAVLWQRDTALRAGTIRIDQTRGNLVAIDAVRSTMPLDSGRLDGRAQTLTYDDASRVLTYIGSSDTASGGASDTASGGASDTASDAASGAAAGAASGAGAAPAGDAQLVGPAGDLRAQRIRVVLHQEGGRAERIEAERDVRVETGGRTATGAAMTYHAEDERYHMTGTIAVPVRVVDACGETTGRSLIFFTSADRMVVDGHEQVRTRTTSLGSCGGARLP